jgi:hypothetical protein
MLLIGEKKHYQMFIPEFNINDIGPKGKSQPVRRRRPLEFFEFGYMLYD